MKKLKQDKKGRAIVPTVFKLMTLKELLPGDILLFFGKNRLTEFHGKYRRKEFGRANISPYHSAIVYDVIDRHDGNPDVMILDQELLGSLSFLNEYLTKRNLHIAVVRFKASPKKRKEMQVLIKELASKEKMYDWKGYLSFASQLPWLNWLKIVKPSKDTFYCSDVVAYVCEKNGVTVSPRGHNFSAPVDLLLYGMQHHRLYTVKMGGELL